MFERNSVIITTNWDALSETYAFETTKPFSYLYLPNAPDVTPILKLHGSVDWTLKAKRKLGRADSDFASLRERSYDGARRLQIWNDEEVQRIRSLEKSTGVWQYIHARTSEPFTITMAPGKADHLEPIRSVWNDAYRDLSAACRIEFIGYSLPPDDVEIRALILAGIRRGDGQPRVSVQNPAPDVHARFRTIISRSLEENYDSFSWA